MNYSEALSFAFRDRNWLKKIVIGGAIAFASFYLGIIFIFGFFVIGYYIGVLRNVAKAVESPLPEWNDLVNLINERNSRITKRQQILRPTQSR